MMSLPRSRAEYSPDRVKPWHTGLCKQELTVTILDTGHRSTSGETHQKLVERCILWVIVDWSDSPQRPLSKEIWWEHLNTAVQKHIEAMWNNFVLKLSHSTWVPALRLAGVSIVFPGLNWHPVWSSDHMWVCECKRKALLWSIVLLKKLSSGKLQFSVFFSPMPNCTVNTHADTHVHYICLFCPFTIIKKSFTWWYFLKSYFFRAIKAYNIHPFYFTHHLLNR